MRKNLGAMPYLFPQPVMIIGSYDEKGEANAMNAAWGGIVGMDKIVIALAKHQTTDNIMLNKAFTVSIADADHVAACDYVGIVSKRKEPHKMEKAGFTTTKSTFVNAPVINELPLTLECELIKVVDGMTLGRIVNVCADERILDEHGKISLDLFSPITYDTVNLNYHKIGEYVGAARVVGKALK